MPSLPPSTITLYSTTPFAHLKSCDTWLNSLHRMNDSLPRQEIQYFKRRLY